MSMSLHDKILPDPPRIGAGNISFPQQTWDFLVDSFCRVAATESVVLKNEKRHLLVVDGGTAKFLYEQEDTVFEVLDLNPYIIGVDLSKKFLTRSLVPAFQKKKSLDVPVLNRHGMWADSNQNRVYIQAGQFYNAPLWNESLYFVPKDKIPPYTIWAFDITTYQWQNITKDVNGTGVFNRTWGGASVSIPNFNQSFHLGGLVTNRTSSTSPNGTFTAQAQFLHFNHTANTLEDRRFYSEPINDGYWHGTLTHIPVGPKGSKGWLISLMSQKGSLNKHFDDKPVENDEFGSNVLFDKVWLYDIEKGNWFQQKTMWFSNDPPPVRTRFCTGLVRDEKLKTWDLWIYGGQLPRGEQLQGVGDAWVLSMPSFIWTRVTIPLARLVNIRSMNCHTVGGQLLIVGGFPPASFLHPNTSCDQELVKVLDLNGPKWEGTYDPNSKYHTPEAVRNRTSTNFPVEWAGDSVRIAFTEGDDARLTKDHIGGIVGGVIGFLIVLALAILFFLWLRKKRTDKKQEPPAQGMPVVLPARDQLLGSVSTERTELNVPNGRVQPTGSAVLGPVELGGPDRGL